MAAPLTAGFNLFDLLACKPFQAHIEPMQVHW